MMGCHGKPGLGVSAHHPRPWSDRPVNAEYRIIFAPLGGRLRSRHALCQGLDGLTDFLRQARVPLPEIERAWQNLARRRIYSVPRVALTPAQIDALGL
jgi:hypothetical protein